MAHGQDGRVDGRWQTWDLLTVWAVGIEWPSNPTHFCRRVRWRIQHRLPTWCRTREVLWSKTRTPSNTNCRNLPALHLHTELYMRKIIHYVNINSETTKLPFFVCGNNPSPIRNHQLRFTTVSVFSASIPTSTRPLDLFQRHTYIYICVCVYI